MKFNHSSCTWLAIAAIMIFFGCTENKTPEKTESSSDTKTVESKAETEPASGSFFVVDKYDPERDPAKDLESTIAKAKPGGKKILLEIGGKW